MSLQVRDVDEGEAAQQRLTAFIANHLERGNMRTRVKDVTGIGFRTLRRYSRTGKDTNTSEVGDFATQVRIIRALGWDPAYVISAAFTADSLEMMILQARDGRQEKQERAA